MIRLTEQQCQELSGENATPARVFNPQANAEFVLLPSDLYEQIKALFEDVPLSEEEEAALLSEAGLLVGWDDPELDVYNNLIP